MKELVEWIKDFARKLTYIDQNLLKKIEQCEHIIQIFKSLQS